MSYRQQERWEWELGDDDFSVHIEVGGRGFPQHEPKQRFLLCAAAYNATDNSAMFGRDSVVKLDKAEQATCEECVLLAAVLKANNVEVRSNDARKFKEHLRKVMGS